MWGRHKSQTVYSPFAAGRPLTLVSSAVRFHNVVLRKPAAALYFLEILQLKDDVFI